MANVYIEPMPKGDGVITGYQIEFDDHSKPLGAYATQADAIAAAKKLGHKPLVAHVRKTNKGIPDHWRSA
ncbi:MAG TPA: DUF2188 domain-containing protein [Gammaproteobacteria bacterium]|nr:DUF2188 domain-containing protein [Gammaproteobacteria bacterium]